MNSSDAKPNTLTKDTKVTLLPHAKKQRIWELDFIRGLSVVLMILDHLAMLIGEIFGPEWYGNLMAGTEAGPVFCRFCAEYLESDFRMVAQPIVQFLFLSICGISCYFSRSNLKRGAQLGFVALLFTAATYLGEELLGISDILITFGVLHFLTVCILLYALIDFLARRNKAATVCVSAAIVIVTVCMYHLYSPPDDTPKFFAIFFPPYDIHGVRTGFYSQADFSPGDLFTLIPYAAFFFFGTFIAPLLYSRRRSLAPCLNGAWQKPVSFIGRHALVIYVLHVALLGALLALISYLFVTPGNWIIA